jgi:hypothetical protein
MKKTITHKPKSKRYKVKSWKQKHKVSRRNYKLGPILWSAEDIGKLKTKKGVASKKSILDFTEDEIFFFNETGKFAASPELAKDFREKMTGEKKRNYGNFNLREKSRQKMEQGTPLSKEELQSFEEGFPGIRLLKFRRINDKYRMTGGLFGGEQGFEKDMSYEEALTDSKKTKKNQGAFITTKKGKWLVDDNIPGYVKKKVGFEERLVKATPKNIITGHIKRNAKGGPVIYDVEGNVLESVHVDYDYWGEEPIELSFKGETIASKIEKKG